MINRAIFLGSFDPPHIGHINCINSVINSGILEQLNIEKIHIIPCLQNPNKINSTDFWHRYKMCQMEFSTFSDWCVIDDIERLLFKTDCQSTYTYQLINYFKGGHDDIISPNFWWIITTETIKELMEQKWKNSKELLYNNNFIVVGENEEEWNNLLTWYCWNKTISAKFVQLNKMDNIHSTQIRQMIKENKDCYPFIKRETQGYIIEHNLYK